MSFFLTGIRSSANQKKKLHRKEDDIVRPTQAFSFSTLGFTSDRFMSATVFQKIFQNSDGLDAVSDSGQ